MDFEPSAKAQDYISRLTDFMDAHVYPAEPVYAEQLAELESAGRGHELPPIVQTLKQQARERGLWNLFLPDESGLSVTDYAPLAEITGRSPQLAPEALNCAAPDTGNMEVLHMFGTAEQKQRWLEPLLAGEIRSGFAMTEPDVASSDATNIATRIDPDGDDYVINGRKWWTTGAMDPRCQILILMGKTDPEAETHRQQSMVLVPMDTPGVRIERNLTVFGYTEQPGHAEISFTDVRVPRSNLIAEEGMGFAIAQARLGPGRVHHCMRAIGMAERALDLMCDRALQRVAFHRPLAAQGVVREWIARSRLAIDQARLLVLQTAWVIDKDGAKAARQHIAGIKAVVPQMALDVVDRAIQTYGGAGVSQATPLAEMWAGLRTLRIADGPDEVHLRDVARLELKAHLDG
ncbi:MAG: acyl-CoA dehydrogenase family protein [Actinobacteria bacterium]|nr:acyl-CoA dehydrogenase family protein [Actinomycetota bacterium]MCB8996180.1 acyl-CoA dehydrogenase family protein [Actinomycetota bacterium]MCB9413941.1 acyl-CoA dehydrogenase family protein [Actinomycetota bacterium]HRY11398.1 acyl-CoA dehydrogenase family protein [Candidatus Nanopelagicales bacterium]